MRGRCKVQRSGSEVQIKSRRFRIRSKVLDQGSELQSEIKKGAKIGELE